MKKPADVKMLMPTPRYPHHATVNLSSSSVGASDGTIVTATTATPIASGA